MKKSVLITLLLSGCWLKVLCQNNEALRIDSTRLDSLKRILPLFKDSARVDLLNLIAISISYNYVGENTVRDDSVHYYFSKAYDEANRIGYKSGIAMGLITLSGFDAVMNKPIKDEATKEKNIRKGIQLVEGSNKYEVLGYGYYYLVGVSSIRNDYEKHENYYKKSIDYFLKAGDTLLAAEVSNWLCSDYGGVGQYENAFDYGKKSVYLSKKASGTNISIGWQEFLVQYSLSSMYELCIAAGDYEGAMNYLREMDQYGKEHKGSEWDIIQFKADLFCKMSKYDSALVYINRWINNGAAIGSGKGHQAIGWGILAKIYIDSTKQYEEAIKLLSNWSDTLKKYHPSGIYAATRFIILTGQAYDKERNYTKALEYASRGVNLAREKNARPEMMVGYDVLSTIYHHLANNDSAYEYLLKYHGLKDSMQNQQFLLRIYNSKKDAEIEKRDARLSLLDKDSKLKTEQLKQQSQQKNFLLILLSLLALAGIFVYRSIYLKRKNERLRLENELTVQRLESAKKHAELKRQASDLQMQALRAQMNPHFIFNSLSSINWFIMENDKDTASDYLTRFSRLMRMVLNAQKPMIPLEDELKMLQLYLDMERLRLENSFDYTITFTNAIDAGNVSIPPMLLQPFCENAIWHGFKNKEGQGHININIRTEDHLLECMITDDGIGRKQAALFKKKASKNDGSMGLGITRGRLALFSEENNAYADFEIEDLVNEIGRGTGTRVILKIVYKEFIEELA